ncbi:MAG: GNAT family N-acetyltransferase [Ignavibacteria bacterium]|nr:GNAT family N-acetyltransferase [Ignavibacteria bacterium]
MSPIRIISEKVNIEIRRAELKDTDQIRFLFRDTVVSINSADYKEEEIKVWSEFHKNKEGWERVITEQYFLVAVKNGLISGFSSITEKGYLDFMYVHKDYQRLGIAEKLLNETEVYARKLYLNKIYSYVSKTAVPFFEKKGFIKTGEVINKVKNIEFINSVMTKEFHY